MNTRPLAPQASALTRLRHVPTDVETNIEAERSQDQRQTGECMTRGRGEHMTRRRGDEGTRGRQQCAAVEDGATSGGRGDAEREGLKQTHLQRRGIVGSRRERKYPLIWSLAGIRESFSTFIPSASSASPRLKDERGDAGTPGIFKVKNHSPALFSSEPSICA